MDLIDVPFAKARVQCETYFLFFLYFWGSSVFEFWLYFRLFFISRLSPFGLVKRAP
jgi:hypothetical protein